MALGANRAYGHVQCCILPLVLCAAFLSDLPCTATGSAQNFLLDVCTESKQFAFDAVVDSETEIY